MVRGVDAEGGGEGDTDLGAAEPKKEQDETATALAGSACFFGGDNPRPHVRHPLLIRRGLVPQSV